MDNKPQSQESDQKQHVVKDGVAYIMIGNQAVNTYVVLGGKRVYVRDRSAGDKMTAEEAKAQNRAIKK